MSPETESLKIDPRLLQSLTGIELRSRHLVRGLYHNRHRTSDFGFSNEFIEHRDYRRGDEIRTIDWRLYARTNRLYIKRYEMESNMRVYFLLDTSESMRVPGENGYPSKLQIAAMIAGAAATMAATQQDSAGLYCLGDAIEERIPARQGVQHLAQIYQHLESPKGKGGGNFGQLVGQATGHLGRRAVVFILSDFLDDLGPLMDALKQLRFRQQDVTLFQILEKYELEFPFDKLTEFRHPETPHKVVGDPVALRAKYLHRLGEHLASLESFCKKTHIEYLRMDTTEDLLKLLRLHFLRRLLGNFVTGKVS